MLLHCVTKLHDCFLKAVLCTFHFEPGFVWPYQRLLVCTKKGICMFCQLHLGSKEGLRNLFGQRICSEDLQQARTEEILVLHVISRWGAAIKGRRGDRA
jgi:hypothetical protein